MGINDPRGTVVERAYVINALYLGMRVYSYFSFFSSGSSPCSNGSHGCSHLCLLRPGGFTCACPYGMDFKYGSNRTCIGK